ncbi:alkaline ceramidase 3-like protein [Fimicolochytrium jonesii]|uniref:alkaline ceramidase 3-like protein n=1 Tax=Fimicolochytrium jonesii TaxID=1396493 RepID=UPI0022FE583F|nr:alkaline ceramidase 3-like protein [Fimicolochytrium jonesii]KAI8824371.1 alkaline ceramidase 3-like protein [Fimicolochytrium jonesii]
MSYNITSLFGGSNISIALGLPGYWGPVTSTLDWCEENYIVSPYLAEWWNATTNLVFLLWPAIGIYSCIKTGAEPRFYASYIALMMVGSGSFLFHGSLTYAMQLLDELPMAMATCVFVYCHLQMFSKNTSPLTIIGLLCTFASVAGSHLFLKTPIIFQLSFVGLTLVQLFAALRNISIIRKIHPSETNLLFGLTALAVGSILAAFALWNTDQIHCGSIQQHRNNIGYPFRIGLELHAWWHLLSGYSGYVSVIGSQYCRMLALGRTDVEVTWIAGILPMCTFRRVKNIEQQPRSRPVSAPTRHIRKPSMGEDERGSVRTHVTRVTARPHSAARP